MRPTWCMTAVFSILQLADLIGGTGGVLALNHSLASAHTMLCTALQIPALIHLNTHERALTTAFDIR